MPTDNMRSTLFLISILFPFCYTLPQGSQTQALQCSSYELNGYHCVPYFLCNETGYIKTDGGGIFDPRASDDDFVLDVDHQSVLQSECDKLIHVCCRHPDSVNKDLGISPTPRPAKPQCGNRNKEGLAIPEGGQFQAKESLFGEWPHVCAVLKEESLGDGAQVKIYQCVGSLISQEVVLTAAHCVKSAKENNANILVRCGEWDTANINESLKHQEKLVMETIIHPEFNERNHHNNFALLVTTEYFDLADHISPVCLPSPGDRFNPQECISNGWGKDKFGSEGRYQTVLKAIQLPLVDQEKCQSRLRKTRLGQHFKLDDSFICAGGEPDIDTCKGDGGGPLTCRYEESGPWVQVGIVSWGIGCGQENTPAVYARVSKAVCWIDKTVSCYLAKLKTQTFSTSTFISSYFGFSPEDCPGDLSPGKCPFVENGGASDNYDYDVSDILEIDTL